MKVTVLTDNIAGDKLLCEWGLSLYIEHQDHKILLDFGMTDVFAKNAALLGIDLGAVDTAVLSHAHLDHSDGMPYFFAQNDKAPLYMQDTAKLKYYGINMNGFGYGGIKPGLLEEFQDRIRYVSEDTEILPDVWLIRHNQAYMKDVNLDEKLLIQEGDHYIRDTFKHEQSLVIELPRGLVIFNSCSHGGVENIVYEVTETLPCRKVYAYLGGMHLFQTPDDEVKALAERFAKLGIERIITGHCTGEKAVSLLQDNPDLSVEQMYSGMEIIL